MGFNDTWGGIDFRASWAERVKNASFSFKRLKEVVEGKTISHQIAKVVCVNSHIKSALWGLKVCPVDEHFQALPVYKRRKIVS